MGARVASESAGLTAGLGANTDATRALAKDQSVSKTGRTPAAKALTGSPAKAKPAYWLAHIEVQTQRDPPCPGACSITITTSSTATVAG